MLWFKNLKIRVKLLLGMGIVLLMMLVFALISLTTMNNVNTYYNNVTVHTVDANIGTLNMQSYVRNIRYALYSMGMNSLRNPSVIPSLQDMVLLSYQNALNAANSVLYNLPRSPRLTNLGHRYTLENYILQAQALISYHIEHTGQQVYNLSMQGNHFAVLQMLEDGNYTIEELMGLLYQASDVARNWLYAQTNAISQQSYTTFIWLTVISIIVIIAALFLTLYISNTISKPIESLVYVSKKVTEGNFNFNVDYSLKTKDEIGALSKDLYNIVNIVKNMIDDISKFTNNVNELGDIDYQMDSGPYTGSYKEIIIALNKFSSDFGNEMFYLFSIADSISEGNFDIEVRNLVGKKIILTQKFESLITNLKDISNNAISMSKNISDGNLAFRIDAKKYSGDWKMLVKSLNHLSNKINRPLVQITNVLTNMSKGEFVHMGGSYVGDFLKIKELFNNTINNVSYSINSVSSILTKIADKDLKQDIPNNFIGDFKQIELSLATILNEFSNVVNDINESASHVSNSAYNISQGSISLARNIQIQNATLEELSANIIETNENNLKNLQKIENVNQICESSSKRAKNGNQDMQLLLSSMESIREYGDKITDVVKTIESIAFQTNLLAINASVEAARAGDMGKGFGVVAEEVRTLANRSKSAAEETAELIGETISRIKEGTSTSKKTAVSLSHIIDDTMQVAYIINEISEASLNQSKSFEIISQGITELIKSITEDSITSQENAHDGVQLSSQAEILHKLVSKFKV